VQDIVFGAMPSLFASEFLACSFRHSVARPNHEQVALTSQAHLGLEIDTLFRLTLYWKRLSFDKKLPLMYITSCWL
jgi:hypothetical protein